MEQRLERSMQLADGAFLANDSPSLPIALAGDDEDRLAILGAVVLRHLDAQLLPRRSRRRLYVGCMSRVYVGCMAVVCRRGR